MNILFFLKLALKVTDRLTKMAHDRQLLSAGEATAIARYNELSYKKLSTAISARRSTDLSADSVRRDENNRANRND